MVVVVRGGVSPAQLVISEAKKYKFAIVFINSCFPPHTPSLGGYGKERIERKSLNMWKHNINQIQPPTMLIEGPDGALYNKTPLFVGSMYYLNL